MPVLLQFVIGLIFGLGLLLSGMSNPAKVLNFLDLGGIAAGTWDPSLALVMAGAVAVTFAGFNFVLKRSELAIRPLRRLQAPWWRRASPRTGLPVSATAGIGWPKK